jgi:mannose-6-phosphate isomerase class I
LTAGSPHASASGTSFEVCENSGITVRIETESLCELHRKTHSPLYEQFRELLIDFYVEKPAVTHYEFVLKAP